MADATYIKNIDALAQAEINLIGGTIIALLVGSGYTPDTSATGHEFLSSISSGDRIASAALTGKTMSGGVFDALDTVIASPPAGQTPKYIVIYQDASPTGSARLIRVIDSAPGLNVPLSGADLTIVWDNGTNKILRIHDA